MSERNKTQTLVKRQPHDDTPPAIFMTPSLEFDLVIRDQTTVKICRGGQGGKWLQEVLELLSVDQAAAPFFPAPPVSYASTF